LIRYAGWGAGHHDQATSALPEVPTLAEQGVTGAKYPIWFGLLAPAQTPREVIDRLNRETQFALQTPKVRDRPVELGVDPMPMSPDVFMASVQREVGLNAALAQKAGLKPE
jgi:tripartite-type tricarboxylate transporter receptor subunit TctC